MSKRNLIPAIVFAAMSGILGAQNAQPRRMTFVGGGSPERGKCTVEVRVDGAAEVEIHGDTADLRNLGGAPPQWRRLECTGPLPRNPRDFRFAGVDGRGSQQLVRDPRNDGSAVVRITDPSGGSEGYTFDIMWGEGGPPPPPPIQGRGDDRDSDRRGFDRDGDAFYHGREEMFRGRDWRMHLFERVREDLEHVQGVTFPFGSDQYRISRAVQELNELQDLQAHGRYDRRQLDDVVRAIGQVLNDNRLARRDREVLAEDMNRLQDFREHSRDYGVR
jgi:hypothetical protein